MRVTDRDREVLFLERRCVLLVPSCATVSEARGGSISWLEISRSAMQAAKYTRAALEQLGKEAADHDSRNIVPSTEFTRNSISHAADCLRFCFPVEGPLGSWFVLRSRMMKYHIETHGGKERG